jgi:hypothetical protein
LKRNSEEIQVFELSQLLVQCIWFLYWNPNKIYGRVSVSSNSL